MDTMQEAFDQARNEEPTTTPVDPPIPTGNEGTTPAPPVPETDYPQSVKDYLAQNPDHAAIAERLNKDFQAHFTPRLQEAADLRKQFEGLDPQVAGAVRHLQQLIQTDPKHAAEYLRQQVQLLEGAQPQEQQAAYPEFATDVEEMLYNRYQTLEQKVAAYEQKVQQAEQQQQVLRINSEFEKLEQELGLQIPFEDRGRAWEMSEAAGGKLSVTDAYFAMNRSKLIPSLVQKARDEASSVVQQKVGMTAPGSLAAREGQSQDTGPQDWAFYFNQAKST